MDAGRVTSLWCRGDDARRRLRDERRCETSERAKYRHHRGLTRRSRDSRGGPEREQGSPNFRWRVNVVGTQIQLGLLAQAAGNSPLVSNTSAVSESDIVLFPRVQDSKAESTRRIPLLIRAVATLPGQASATPSTRQNVFTQANDDQPLRKAPGSGRMDGRKDGRKEHMCQ
ncbi:hypothetical protein C8Q74DRAFT_1437300 [Fomes fomentarius]|nr:hypothetical protein C8Q74DRAFT_1437300 [Fomes fomentarius]